MQYEQILFLIKNCSSPSLWMNLAFQRLSLASLVSGFGFGFSIWISLVLVLAGMFVLGIGAGITADTVLNVEPNNVASREVIDRQTPNPDVCIANGMSAMVLDQRLFISFNP